MIDRVTLNKAKVRQQRITGAQTIINKHRPPRDVLIRRLVANGAGIRETAAALDMEPSSVHRICERPPAVKSPNKPRRTRTSA